MEQHIPMAKRVLFVLCLLPLAYYGLALSQDALGANPIDAFTRGLGSWALRLLLVTLAITPLRRLTGWTWLLKLRRMLGLFVFLYASLHLATYLWLDQFFDWSAIGKDIVKRPFITAGMLAFTLLLPLAATSNRVMIQRLGGKRWQELHRLIYPLAMIAVLHYTWLVKADASRPALYGAVLALLLGLRLWWRIQGVTMGPQRAMPATFAKAGSRVIPIIQRR